MAYTTNPKLPRLRARAVDMVRSGKSVTEVARYFGYSKGAVSKWCRKAPVGGTWEIPTWSSRPKHHPKQTRAEIVRRIVTLRRELKGRCGEVIHEHLKLEGLAVSLRTVQRVLDRQGLLRKRSPWKRLHIPLLRPEAAKPGDLVQVDTVHLMKNGTERMYVYTLLDVASRWAYARAYARANNRSSLDFLKRAQGVATFPFTCLQSDHGSEFSQNFTERVKLTHRHSRVRRPNDNAHLERFNRTIQTELLDRLPRNPWIINRQLPAYLRYYNQERLHLGINLKTPSQILQKCFQGIV